jgi:GNAT superfamily N-acetyltransferase
MARPGQLVPSGPAAPEVRIDRTTGCPPSFYRYLYAEVGREWHWVDRLSWDDETIRAHLAQDSVTLWVLRIEGAPAGWFELKRYDDGSVEIAYFGILPAFRRRGLGKRLLTAAVTEAWRAGASRVWLHTCTLDDPAALPNYLARGFTAFKEETYEVDL